MYKNVEHIKTRLSKLKANKELKKDLYKTYPNTKTYKEIIEIISEIKYLETRIKYFN